MSAWLVALLAIGYVAGLFGVANWAERHAQAPVLQRWGGVIYSLALAVYCTSWTYYGAVGSAIHSGWDYLSIYLGPILVLVLAQPMLAKLLLVAKKHNVTSITDFISARYGKRHAIAVLTTVLCLVVVIPYIALQLKAVAQSYQVLLGQQPNTHLWWQNSALMSTLAMTVFAILFGTRKVSLTEHNRGVMVAIAFESVIKLGALVLLACAVSYFVVDQPWLIIPDFSSYATTKQLQEPFSVLSFLTKTVLAMAAIFLLPRQFHVMFVENTQPAHLKQAKRWFGSYLVLIALVMMPIAVAGKQLFPQQLDLADRFVLLLPASQGWNLMSALVFIGGFSAATSMIIIATLALSTMISNGIVIPALLPRQQEQLLQQDYSAIILRIRRLMIMVVMALSYGYYMLFARKHELAETGLLAFALAIQLAPAVLGGLYWRRGHAYGVYAGISCGMALWFYCLMLPQLVNAGVVEPSLLVNGAWGITWLRPTALLGLHLDPLTHGVLWSLGVNTLAYLVLSILYHADLEDRLQALAFVRPNLSSENEEKVPRRIRITSADLLTLLERFVGVDHAQVVVKEFESSSGQPVWRNVTPSARLIQHIELELAGVIGSASAAAMVNAVLDGKQLAFEEVVTLFDDTRQAIQFSRHILFATLENLSQGVSVVDRDLQLVAWNKKYLEMFHYPEGMIKVGRPIAEIVRFNAERGLCGLGSPEEHVNKRIQHMQRGTAHVFQRVRPDGSVIEIRGNPIPDGGFVTTFTDITEHVQALHQLAEAKQNLEQRVQERTQEISQINAELRAEIDLRRITESQLLQAKAEAEAANASKNRFLALASHDILQPLNAARLFTVALSQQATTASPLLTQLDNSLKATEELIATLLDIARLDDGKLDPARQTLDVQPLLQQLEDEFSLLAQRKSLKLRVHIAAYHIESNPTYLRRILQNMLSNAIKYTDKGKVLLGCRRRGQQLWFEVWDTGAGIAEVDLPRIFDDFYRVDATARGQQGIGLGLGVVQRMAKSLGHELSVQSVLGKGSVFRLAVPIKERSIKAVAVDNMVATPNKVTQPLAGVSVICIDDDKQNLAALTLLLQQWQVASVRSYIDCDHVLAEAKQAPAPDLVIVDYQLGQQIDGLTLAQQLKSAWPSVSVLLVSAAPEPDLPSRARKVGAMFLAKPIKAGALKAVLHSVRLAKVKT